MSWVAGAQWPRGGRTAGLLDASAVVAGAVAGGVVLDLLHVPSAALFGGLLAGVVRGLAGPRRLGVPRPAMTAAQALVGVSIGVLVQLGPRDQSWLGAAPRREVLRWIELLGTQVAPMVRAEVARRVAATA